MDARTTPDFCIIFENFNLGDISCSPFFPWRVYRPRTVPLRISPRNGENLFFFLFFFFFLIIFEFRNFTRMWATPKLALTHSHVDRVFKSGRHIAGRVIRHRKWRPSTFTIHKGHAGSGLIIYEPNEPVSPC